MKNQSKFGLTRDFLSSLATLFGSLLAYDSALSYHGQENNFLADNWGEALAILLVLMFGLGWWVGYLIEYKGREIAILVTATFILAYLLAILSPSVLPIHDFLKYAIFAGAFSSLSGFLLRSSVAQSGITTKRHDHD